MSQVVIEKNTCELQGSKVCRKDHPQYLVEIIDANGKAKIYHICHVCLDQTILYNTYNLVAVVYAPLT